MPRSTSVLHHEGRPPLETPEERARAAARDLLSDLNEMGFDSKSFADEIMRGHRTLQQSAFSAFLACVKAWSGLDANRYDARNEYTCQKSREIAELLGKYGMEAPYI